MAEEPKGRIGSTFDDFLKEEGVFENVQAVALKKVVERLSASRTADFFEKRRARADVDAALSVMSRKCGETPRIDDEV